MSRRVVLALLVLPLTFAAVITSRPSKLEVARSVSIDARQVRVFEVATDLRRWAPWKGWDPGATEAHDGPAHGFGSGLLWTSRASGKVKLTTSEVSASNRVGYVLEEIDPEPNVHLTQLTLSSTGLVTTATWSTRRHLGFFDKGQAMFGAFDGVASKFEHGLARLKSAAESRDDAPSTLYCSFCGKSQREVRKLIAGPNVYICDECIKLCNDVIAEEIEKDRAGHTDAPAR